MLSGPLANNKSLSKLIVMSSPVSPVSIFRENFTIALPFNILPDIIFASLSLSGLG